MDVIAFTFKNVMLFEPNFNVQVACGAAIGTRLAIARAANAHATINSGWNFDFKGFLFFDLALAVAGHARLGNHLTGAATGRTGLLDAEKTLTHLHRTRATARTAGFDRGAGLGAIAFANIAGVPARNADLGIFTFGRFFQRDFHGVTQVAAAKHLATAARATTTLLAKHVAKNITKGLSKTAHTLATGTRAAHVGVNTGETMLIVGCALLRIRQHLVGFLGLFELFLCHLGRIALVAVRVMLHRVFAISLFNFFVGSVLGNAQDFVIVSFRHGLSVPVFKTNAAMNQ